MSVRVGVPRALWYYTYFPFWQAFFAELGASLVPSQPTTKATLDAGVLDTVSEACVPIKLYFGHVRELRDAWRRGEIDMLFVPRFVNWEENLVFCPKFLGLPDMVRHGYDCLPPLLDIRIDRRRGPWALWRSCFELGCRLGKGRLDAWRAYRAGCRAQREQEKRLRSSWWHTDAILGRRHVSPASRIDRHPLRLAVLAYPYLLGDSYVSLSLLNRLEDMGVEVVIAEALAPLYRGSKAGRQQKSLFWTYSEMVKRAGYWVMRTANSGIDGVIHVTAFGCGPDATVGKLLELEAREPGSPPFLSLCLDEQTGEAGCLTRLEAFVDMLRRRQER